MPDWSFSDRLSSGNRTEVSRIVANTVRQVYHGNGGQPDPELSSTKLQATVEAWKKRGFDPTDKKTWDKMPAVSLAPEFYWKPEEVIKVGVLQRLLNVPLQVALDAVKFFLRLVKSNKREIAVTLVKKLLEQFGIRCGHNGKVNKFLTLLCQWDWIRVTAKERWYAREIERKGRARTYAVGGAMRGKFEEKSKGGVAEGGEEEKDLSITPHRIHRSCEEPANNPPILTGKVNNWAFNGRGDIERNRGSP